MQPFVKSFEVRWDDLDANRHLANTSYAKFMTHVRFAFFAEHGLSQAAFAELAVGPVILAERLSYRREVHALETVDVDLQLVGLSQNQRSGMFRHHVRKQNGDLAAVSEVTFAWLDLRARKIVDAPATLMDVLERMPTSSDFRTLTKEDIALGWHLPS